MQRSRKEEIDSALNLGTISEDAEYRINKSEVSEEVLRSLFTYMDSDGNGNISVLELMNGIRELQNKYKCKPHGGHSSPILLFQALDTDSSGGTWAYYIFTP